MKHDHFVRDQSCTDPERRWGGGGGGGGETGGRTHLVTSSIGNKQLSSTPTPGKCLTPFGTKYYIFSELIEYNEGMSNMLGVSIYWTRDVYF